MGITHDNPRPPGECPSLRPRNKSAMGVPPPPMPRCRPHPFVEARQKWIRSEAIRELEAYLEGEQYAYRTMPEGTMFINGEFLSPPVRPVRPTPPHGFRSCVTDEK